MGAWGTGSFDNDGALDLVGEYRDGSIVIVERTLMALTDFADGEYIDADLGQMAIAAAEIIAVCNGKLPVGLNAQIRADVLSHQAEVVANDDLVAYAKAGLPKLLDPDSSEVYQLWEEATPEDFAAFKAAMTDLARRLGEIG